MTAPDNVTLLLFGQGFCLSAQLIHEGYVDLLMLNTGATQSDMDKAQLGEAGQRGGAPDRAPLEALLELCRVLGLTGLHLHMAGEPLKHMDDV